MYVVWERVELIAIIIKNYIYRDGESRLPFGYPLGSPKENGFLWENLNSK